MVQSGETLEENLVKLKIKIERICTNSTRHLKYRKHSFMQAMGRFRNDDFWWNPLQCPFLPQVGTLGISLQYQSQDLLYTLRSWYQHQLLLLANPYSQYRNWVVLPCTQSWPSLILLMLVILSQLEQQVGYPYFFSLQCITCLWHLLTCLLQEELPSQRLLLCPPPKAPFIRLTTR